MKPFASALALAILLVGPASATVFRISEHDYTTIVHGEVLGGDHASVKKTK